MNQFVSPTLTPGDVRSLVLSLDGILREPLMPAQRAAVLAIRGRLMQDGSEPPNLPLAVAAWLSALEAGDKDAIVRDGVVMVEASYLCGDIASTERMHEAMESVATKIVNDRASRPETASDGPGNEKGSTDGIDWIDPDPERFYVLGGPHGDAMRELVEDLRHVERYVTRGIDAPTRLLFVGDPGNGKTEGAKHIGAALGKPVALFRLAKIGSSYINRTSRNLAACFEAAEKRNAIILIDELNGIGTRRDAQGPGTSDGERRVIDALTQTFDALNPSQIVIGCTNIPDAIDPAIAGRLMRHVTFGPPSRDMREAMLRYHWRKMLYNGVTIDRIIDLTDGRSGRTVRFAAHDAARRAIRAGRDTIEIADVHAAMVAVPREGKLAERSIL